MPIKPITYDVILNRLRQEDVGSSTTVGNLSAVLATGNKTGGNDIIITNGDMILGTFSPVSGGDVDIIGGVSISGDGGDLMFAGGVTVSGEGGDLIFAGGDGFKGGDVDIFGGTSTSGGVGDVTIQGLIYPNADGTFDQVMTTDGAGNLSFRSVTDIISGELNTISGDVKAVSADVITLSSNQIIISGDVEDIKNTLEKDTFIIPASQTRFGGGVLTGEYRSAKWLVTMTSAVSSEYEYLEVQGIHLDAGVTRFNRRSRLGDRLAVNIEVEVSGGLLGLNCTNNEAVDVNLQYIRLA